MMNTQTAGQDCGMPARTCHECADTEGIWIEHDGRVFCGIGCMRDYIDRKELLS